MAVFNPLCTLFLGIPDKGFFSAQNVPHKQTEALLMKGMCLKPTFTSWSDLFKSTGLLPGGNRSLVIL